MAVTEAHAAHTGDHPEGAPAHPVTSTGLSNEKIAMWAFLGSECLLFGALISTYLLYRGRSVVGPYPHDVYDIPYTSVSSFVLLMSSLTMVLALAAMQRHDQRRMRVWLLTTALLGTTPTTSTPPAPASATTRSPCGRSSARSACSSAP